MENQEQDQTGQVKISNEVIAAIAGKTAKEVDGVAGLTDRFVDSVTKILAGEYQKGVEVNITEKVSKITLSLVVNFDYPIPKISKEVQEKVQKAVEKMTGIPIEIVNINIQGINLDKEEPENPKKVQKK